jgi:hypothetical protein
MFEYTADASIPAPIRAVNLLLTSPLPSLTALVAIFYPTDEYSDISDELRKYFTPRVTPISIRAKGRIARFTHALPFSRAKDVYYNFWISDPAQLQREHVNNLFSELEAHCWQWLNRRALGKVGVLAIEHRPSIRCLLLDNLEPYGPIERQPFRLDPEEGKRWRDWCDSDSEQPYREPRGPLGCPHGRPRIATVSTFRRKTGTTTPRGLLIFQPTVPRSSRCSAMSLMRMIRDSPFLTSCCGIKHWGCYPLGQSSKCYQNIRKEFRRFGILAHRRNPPIEWLIC